MYKMLATAATIGVLVIFGMQNSDHVPVSLVIGPPIQIRLIFLLLIAAGCGFLVAYFPSTIRALKLKKEIAKLSALAETGGTEIAQTPSLLRKRERRSA